jgi:DNA-binding beta-propeller fold protein YncE
VGQFRSPSIKAAPDGLIYVADAENDRIQVVDGAGRVVAAWGSKGAAPGQFSYPIGIAADAAGNVYVADFGNDRVQKFRFLPVLTPTGTPTG